MSDSSDNNEEVVGLDALQAKLNEMASDDSNSLSKEDLEATNASDSAEAPIVEEVQDSTPVVEAEAVKADEVVEPIAVEGDSPAVTSPDTYTPNLEYKYQDEIFKFDDRVAAAIKTKEDEEYFRDLYTKSAAMELMKERADNSVKSLQEVEVKYGDLETRSKENDSVINYWTGLMEGISKGDANSFNQLLSLCKVDNNTLQRLGSVMADHLENPTGYNAQQQMAHAQYQTEMTQNQRNNLAAQQESLAITKTELAISQALSNPEISEIASFVDEKLGAGSFEKAVWAEGEKLQAVNPNISFSDVPNIVKAVAEQYSKFKPVADTSPTSKPVITQRVVNNNTTATLPTVKGEPGVPGTPKYKEGSGVDGLLQSYKNVTGKEW